MRVSSKTRQQMWLQNIFYYTLVLTVAGLCAWLSVRYSFEFDWSANNRNTLSQSSRDVIQQLDSPINVTAFVISNKELHDSIRAFVERYKKYNDKISLEFIDPQANPAKTREQNISAVGEIVIEYKNYQERLNTLSEQTFTNALQRLARGEERWIVFLSGHGEHDPFAQHNNGYSVYSESLSLKGFNVQSLSLITEQSIPDNTHILIIASPDSKYLPGEQKIIIDYVKKGGNLLWLTEPESDGGLSELARKLGIGRLPGKIIDADGQLYGVNQPDFVLVVNYNDQHILRNFNTVTLFPQAVGITHNQSNPLGLSSNSLLQSVERSWNETGPIEGKIEINEADGEVAGPIDIGFSLQRSLAETTLDGDAGSQRIIVIGDGDFLTNGYIGNGGNAQLGLNIMNWLSHDDDLISIDPVSAPDTRLLVSDIYLVIFALLFLCVIPVFLTGAGIRIWSKRKKI